MFVSSSTSRLDLRNKSARNVCSNDKERIPWETPYPASQLSLAHVFSHDLLSYRSALWSKCVQRFKVGRLSISKVVRMPQPIRMPADWFQKER